MAINFPTSPTTNVTTHTHNGVTYLWDGTSWVAQGSTAQYTLPTASSTVLGGIKVGQRLTIASGVLEADVQASTYGNSDVDTHLNQSNPTSGHVLSWNGSDYAWVAQTAAYTNSSVDAHLNQSNPTGGYVLAWDGSDYDWQAPGTNNTINNNAAERVITGSGTTGELNASDKLTLASNGIMTLTGQLIVDKVNINDNVIQLNSGTEDLKIRGNGTGGTYHLTLDDDVTITGDLTVNGSGGGGGSPGGSNTQMQYNNNGAFGGTSLKYSTNLDGSLEWADASGTSGARISCYHPTISGGDGSILFYAGAGLLGTINLRVFNNSVTVYGALTKGGGSFRIPHPLPALNATKDLAHSFIEGPQCDNLYRGKVDLVGGTATINIDTKAGMTEGTFVVLNRDIQCFTSNETGWTAVKGSVSGNILTITAQDNTCTDTISWMVVGERQDDTVKGLDITDADGNLVVEPDQIPLPPTV